MSVRGALIAAVILGTLSLPTTGHSADFTCNGLVRTGQKLICPGFEPNWAIELACTGGAMTSNVIDAFSGASIETTPGSVSFSTENPWTFSTDTGVAGAIAYTPGACQDEAEIVHDFTFTPTAAPGLSGPFFPFCCRIE